VPASARPEAELRRHLREQLRIEAPPGLALRPARHTVTYRRVTLLPYLIAVEKLPSGAAGAGSSAETQADPSTSVRIPLSAVGRWPTSSATRKILRRAVAALKFERSDV